MHASQPVYLYLSLKFILTSMDIGGENGHRFSLSQLNCWSICPPSLCGRKSIGISMAPREMEKISRKKKKKGQLVVEDI